MKLNSGFKQKFLRAVAGGALVAGLLPASNAFAVAAFPTTGSCAMLVTKPVPVGTTMPFSTVYNIFAILNFTGLTTGTIDYTGTVVDYTANGTTVTQPPSGAIGAPMTIGSDPGAPANVKVITITPPTGKAITANAVAVNNGSTILIQGKNDAFSGVCQF